MAHKPKRKPRSPDRAPRPKAPHAGPTIAVTAEGADARGKPIFRGHYGSQDLGIVVSPDVASARKAFSRFVRSGL